MPGLTANEEPLSEWKAVKNFIDKSFRSIMVPYYIWAFIGGWLIDIDFLKSVLTGTQKALEGHTDSILWFLPALFVARMFYWGAIQLIHLIAKRNSAEAKLIFAVGFIGCGAALGKVFENAIPLGADIGLVGCGLMLISSLLRKRVIELREGRRAVKVAVLVAGAIWSVIFGFLNMPYTVSPDGQVVYNVAVWMARGMYGKSVVLFVLSSLSGCAAVLALAMIVEKLSFLAVCGRHTLGLMVIHNKVYPTAAAAAATVSALIGISGFGIQIMAVLFALLFSAPWVFLVARFAPFLEGKQNAHE